MATDKLNLDPKDWDSMREMGHQIVDDMINYLRDVRSRPIWENIPDNLSEQFSTPLPTEEEKFEDIYTEIKDKVLKYPMGNIHPRFWGWVIGTGTIQSSFADFIASTLNSNAGGGNHSAPYVESQVIEWSKEMLGFDEQSSGLLTSGGSMANLVGLTVARQHQVTFDIRKEGISNHQLRYYASTEVHSSVQKAIELMGIGYKNLVKIPVDKNFQIKIDILEKKIKEDLENNLIPVCIVGNLGTVNTGAIDDLVKLADIAAKYNLWFHVDGAFGAITAITPNFSHLANGLKMADSIAFDFHKWMYVNYEVGCILVKHQLSHYQSFSLQADYLEHGTRGVHGNSLWFSDYGVELSRGFKALKVWTSIKEHGIAKYGKVVEQNILEAKYLTGLVEKASNLELMAPTSMNIVCFRFVPEGETDQRRINNVNRELLIKLHEQAIAVPSYTVIDEKYVLRVAITNHRSEFFDFDLLVENCLRIGSIVSLEIP